MRNNKLTYALLASITIVAIGAIGAAYLFFDQSSSRSTGITSSSSAITAISSIVDGSGADIPELNQQTPAISAPLDLENIVGLAPSCAAMTITSGSPNSCFVTFNREVNDQDAQNVRLTLVPPAGNLDKSIQDQRQVLECQKVAGQTKVIECKTEKIVLKQGSYAVSINIYGAELLGFGPNMKVIQ